MSNELKTAIDKLKVVKNLSQSAETQQVCDIVIDVIDSLRKKDKELGFTINEAKISSKRDK